MKSVKIRVLAGSSCWGVVWACCPTRRDALTTSARRLMKALFSYTIGAGLFVYSLLALVYTTYAIFSNVWPFNLSSGPRSFSPFVARNSRSSAVNFTLSPTDPSFVSRAFSNSMRPSSITPFYYKAANHFDDDDITITTLVTGNRFHVFAQLVSTYQGDWFAAICAKWSYIPSSR